MSEPRGRGVVVLALALLLVGGCAPSGAISRQGSSTGSPGTDGPTNFAHPDDMIKRYPTMRRQDL